MPSLLSVVVVAAVAHVQACGGDEGLSSTVDDDAGQSSQPGDAIAFGDDGGASLSTLRLAHLAPSLGTIDFCYAARAGSFEGPVLRGGGADPDASADGASTNPAGDGGDDAALDATPLDATADGGGTAVADASTPGLAYGTVTKYFTLQATGTITVAIVPAGRTSCGNPIAEGTVTLDPGKLSTVTLFDPPPSAADEDGGEAGALPAQLIAFTDNRDTESDRARVRMIHAAPGGALTVRVTGATTTPIADRLEPRKASEPSKTIPVDQLGFATIIPVAPPAAIVVTPFVLDGGATPVSWQSAAVDLDLRGDSLHTGFVLNGADGGFEILWCADKSTTAELTACARLR